MRANTCFEMTLDPSGRHIQGYSMGVLLSLLRRLCYSPNHPLISMSLSFATKGIFPRLLWKRSLMWQHWQSKLNSNKITGHWKLYSNTVKNFETYIIADQWLKRVLDWSDRSLTLAGASQRWGFLDLPECTVSFFHFSNSIYENPTLLQMNRVIGFSSNHNKEKPHFPCGLDSLLSSLPKSQ